MRELTLKELAPYLPYRLMVLHDEWGEIEMDAVGDMNKLSIMDVPKYAIPILRNLSDLTREKYWELSGADPSKSFGFWYHPSIGVDSIHCEGYSSKKYHLNEISGIPYYMMEFFFKNHFDVFGLIESGLAVDINTLSDATK